MNLPSRELDVDDPAAPGVAAFDGGLSTVTAVTPLRACSRRARGTTAGP